MEGLLKNKKGITLVALVVTIVVLIILAGIAINLVIGENGIISKAKQAKEMQEMSDIHDKLELIRGKVALDNETIVTWDKYKAELIKENIITGDNDVEDIENGKKQIVTDTGYVAVIEITSDGTVGKIEIIGKKDSLKVNIINVAVTSETSSIKVDVTANRTENATFKYYYKTEGGEYQTSPVHEGTDLSYTITNLAQNTTYTIKVEATNKNGTVEKEIVAVTIKDPTIADKKGGDVLSATDNTKIKDDNGNEVTIPAGFKIASNSATAVTGGVVIEDKDGNQYVWIPVDNINEYKRTDFGKQDGNYSYYFDIITSNDDQTSVTTYKGYYIGRYEAGDSVSTANKTLRVNGASVTNKVAIKKGQAPYNFVTIDQAKTLAEEMDTVEGYTKGTTKLCTSYAWDTAINFIQRTNSDYGTNSWEGNYKDTTFSYTDITGITKTSPDYIMPTGQTTAVSNIYDMGGNVYEWTTETANNVGPVPRGGSANNSYKDAPAGYRNGTSPALSLGLIAFRITLYL